MTQGKTLSPGEAPARRRHQSAAPRAEVEMGPGTMEYGNPAEVSESTCSICSADATFLRSSRPAYEALSPKVRLVDLFRGCAGLSIGVAEAARRLGLGIEIPFAIDVDEDATRVYKANFPQADVRIGRVEDFSRRFPAGHR